jgi:triacylglycerol lipase
MRYGIFKLGKVPATYMPHTLTSAYTASRTFSNFRQQRQDEKPLNTDLGELGRIVEDDFTKFRAKYEVPKHPIVLAHGLLGFDELHLAGRYFPGLQYWRGIKQAYHKNGIEVITTSVPTTGSIEQRAKTLYAGIKARAPGKSINIIAHSMGGLDARYLISQLKPTEFTIKSLTTIATPHRGSALADIILREIGAENLPGIYSLMARLRLDSGAFSQLTRKYMTEDFNPANPNDPDVRYFSYGASAQPSIFSIFWLSHKIVQELEGPNDGVVSVASSKWGEDGYKGTLMGVTHLDLINWTNRMKKLMCDLSLMKQKFNAIAFYLAVADMLAREGL